MEKQLEAQMSTMLEYPVARKRGKIYRGFFKGRPNFKKLSEGNRLILLIGLEDSKKLEIWWSGKKFGWWIIPQLLQKSRLMKLSKTGRRFN